MISVPPIFGIIFIIYLIISLTLLLIPFRRYFIDQKERKKRNKPEIKSRNYFLVRKALYYSIFDPNFLISSESLIENSEFYHQYKSLLYRVNEFLTEDYITVQNEIELLNKFLDIEKIRKEQLFDFNITISNDLEADNCRIPSMILLPLIAATTRNNLTTPAFFKIEIDKIHESRVKINLIYSYGARIDSSEIKQQLKEIITDVKESLSHLYMNNQFKIKQYIVDSSGLEHNSINIEVILPFNSIKIIGNFASTDIPESTYRSLNYNNRSLNLAYL